MPEKSGMSLLSCRLQRVFSRQHRGQITHLTLVGFESTFPIAAIMLSERELQLSPIVQESVLHNTKVRPVLPIIILPPHVASLLPPCGSLCMRNLKLHLLLQHQPTIATDPKFHSRSTPPRY